MKAFLILMTTLAAGIAASAHAQPGPDSLVRCESIDGRARECPVGPVRDARLVRQLSRSPCIEGRSWGVGRGSLWVDGGCRGEFLIDDRGRGRGERAHGGYVRCESDKGRWNRCAVPARGRVELVRQLSRSSCVRGQSWGVDGQGIWVNNGCRAEFRVAGGHAPAPRRFNCESVDGRERFCPAGSGDVRLVRQISRAACIEGRSWGRTRDGVWVAQGCRAEFETGWRGR